jgi:predicted  nucleic acid-binding Zn-ribbon protein
MARNSEKLNTDLNAFAAKWQVELENFREKFHQHERLQDKKNLDDYAQVVERAMNQVQDVVNSQIAQLENSMSDAIKLSERARNFERELSEIKEKTATAFSTLDKIVIRDQESN